MSRRYTGYRLGPDDLRRDENYIVDSQYEDQVRKDFQEGLSAHGSRYFHPFYEIEHNQ